MPEYLYSSYDDESIEKGTFGQEYIPRYYDNSHPQEEINDFILYYNPIGSHNIYFNTIVDGELKKTVQLKFQDDSEVPIFTYRITYYLDGDNLYIYGTSYSVMDAKFISCIGKANFEDISHLSAPEQQGNQNQENQSTSPQIYTMTNVKLDNTITGNFGACYPGHHRIFMEDTMMEYDLPEDFPFPGYVEKLQSRLILPEPRYFPNALENDYYIPIFIYYSYNDYETIVYDYLTTSLRYRDIFSLYVYQMGCTITAPVDVGAMFIYSLQDEKIIRPILRIPSMSAVYFHHMLIIEPVVLYSPFSFGFSLVGLMTSISVMDTLYGNYSLPALIPVYCINTVEAHPQLYTLASTNYTDIFTGTPIRQKEVSYASYPYFLIHNSGKSTFLFMFTDPNDFPIEFDPWYTHQLAPDNTHIMYKYNSAFWEEGIISDGLVIAKNYFYNIHEPLWDVDLGGKRYYIDGDLASNDIPANETPGILHADNCDVIATTFDVTIHIPGDYEGNVHKGKDLIDFENTPANSVDWDPRYPTSSSTEESMSGAGFILNQLWQQGVSSEEGGMLYTSTTTTENMLFGSANMWVNHETPRKIMTESENSFLIGVSSTGVFNKTEDKVKEYIGNLRKDDSTFTLAGVSDIEVEINITVYVAIALINNIPSNASKSAFQFRHADIALMNGYGLARGMPYHQADYVFGIYNTPRSLYVPSRLINFDEIYVSIYKYDVDFTMTLSVKQINRNDFEGYECVFTKGMMLSEGSRCFLLKPLPDQNIQVSSSDLELIAFYTRPATVIGYPKIEEVLNSGGTTDIVVAIKDRLIVLSKTPEEQQIQEQVQQEWEQPSNVEDTLTLYSSDYTGKVYDISSLVEAEPFVFMRIGALPTILEDNLKIIDVTYNGAVPSF